MNNMPDKIYIMSKKNPSDCDRWQMPFASTSNVFHDVEYVRADLAPQWQPVSSIPLNIQVLIYGVRHVHRNIGGEYKEIQNGEPFIATAHYESDTRPDGSVWDWYHVYGADGYECENDFENKDVTHWMELPKAPT